MSQEQNNSKTFLTSRQVARRLKCATDYVSRLCREDKLTGQQIDGVWFVDPSSVAEFEAARFRAKEERSRVLAQQRRSETLQYKKVHGSWWERLRLSQTKHSLLTAMPMAVGVFLLLGALVFASASDLPATSTAASFSATLRNDIAGLGQMVVRVFNTANICGGRGFRPGARATGRDRRIVRGLGANGIDEAVQPAPFPRRDERSRPSSCLVGARCITFLIILSPILRHRPSCTDHRPAEVYATGNTNNQGAVIPVEAVSCAYEGLVGYQPPQE